MWKVHVVAIFVSMVCQDFICFACDFYVYAILKIAKFKNQNKIEE